MYLFRAFIKSLNSQYFISFSLIIRLIFKSPLLLSFFLQQYSNRYRRREGGETVEREAMLDFGDELIIESYKIPWLIWIHLLVTILFVILIFFGFGVFTSENPSVSVTSASASTSNPSQPNQNRSSHRTKVNENRRTRRDVGTSEGTIVEEVHECEESSLDDSIFFRIFRYPNHPCNYLGLVKQALFKCFGLDSRFEKRRKED